MLPQGQVEPETEFQMEAQNVPFDPSGRRKSLKASSTPDVKITISQQDAFDASFTWYQRIRHNSSHKIDHIWTQSNLLDMNGVLMLEICETIAIAGAHCSVIPGPGLAEYLP